MSRNDYLSIALIMLGAFIAFAKDIFSIWREKKSKIEYFFAILAVIMGVFGGSLTCNSIQKSNSDKQLSDFTAQINRIKADSIKKANDSIATARDFVIRTMADSIARLNNVVIKKQDSVMDSVVASLQKMDISLYPLFPMSLSINYKIEMSLNEFAELFPSKVNGLMKFKKSQIRPTGRKATDTGEYLFSQSLGVSFLQDPNNRDRNILDRPVNSFGLNSENAEHNYFSTEVTLKTPNRVVLSVLRSMTGTPEEGPDLQIQGAKQLKGWFVQAELVKPKRYKFQFQKILFASISKLHVYYEIPLYTSSQEEKENIITAKTKVRSYRFTYK